MSKTLDNTASLFKQTKRKIVAISMITVMAGTLVFSALVTTFYYLTLYSSIEREIMSRSSSLEMNVDKFFQQNLEFDEKSTVDFAIPPEGGNNKTSKKFLEKNNPLMSVYIYKNSEMIFSQKDLRIDNIKDENIKLTEKTTRFVFDGHQYLGNVVTSGNYEIFVCCNADSEYDSLLRLVFIVGGCLIATFFVSLILGKILSNKAIAPVEEAYLKQEQFVQDAAHEMRTPLAVIKGKIELMTLHPKTTIEENYEGLSNVVSEIVGMEKMNKNLLMLTKINSGNAVKLTEFMVSQLANEICEFFSVLAEGEEKKFVVDIKDDLSVFWDYEKTKQCIIILMDNAFKYTTTGGEVTLTVEEHNKSVVFQIKDDGCGIDEASLTRIYDRFFRADSARASDVDGNGIGLSVLKAICDGLKISVDVKSQTGVGTTFALNIPKKMQ